MQGWNREMYYTDTGLSWIPPSPNLPTPVSAMVYPGQVLWEATNVSEGRGTTQPFELFGAPFIDSGKLLLLIKKSKPKGVFLRPVAFEPTANKWAGCLCHGFQIHITNPVEFKPFLTSLTVLQALIFQHPNQFEWKSPPYEYEFERPPIDLLIGNRKIRERIENLEEITEIEKSWQEDLDGYQQISRNFHLYR
jgi:uncharacterized protein YbbC (DUF1343 family)